MAVKIRLTTMGDKKSPFYRIVVADSRKSRDGEVIDLIGTFNPLTNPETIKVDAEKATDWLKKGAQPTDTAKALLVKANVTFPENYHAEGLKGKPAVFHVKLLGIREKQMPEINDDFAKDVSEFNTLAELKADIKKKKQESKEAKT